MYDIIYSNIRARFPPKCAANPGLRILTTSFRGVGAVSELFDVEKIERGFFITNGDYFAAQLIAHFYKEVLLEIFVAIRNLELTSGFVQLPLLCLLKGLNINK